MYILFEPHFRSNIDKNVDILITSTYFIVNAFTKLLLPTLIN